MAPATELQDLPDELLSQIAQRVKSQERRTLLPVLSRRWAGLLQGPGPAWAEVSIDEDEFSAEALPDSIAIMKWFSRRTGSVRNMTVLSSVGEEGLPACLVPAVLTSQAASLRELHINCDADMISIDRFAVLVALTALESLAIYVLEGEVDWGVNGAGIVRTLSLLPALKELNFVCDFTPVDTAPHSVGHLATLRSPTLTQMVFSVPSEGTLTLGALPALVTCELLFEKGNGPAREALHVPPAAFSGATNITRLKLGAFVPQQTRLPLGGRVQLVLAPRCFSSLSVLERLSLIRCGLTEVAAALSGVGRTLRWLDLGGNPGLQLAPHCFRSLGVLEDLCLSDCGLTGVPAALIGLGRTLRQLQLSYNLRLQLAPHCFRSLRKLEVLSIESCGLTVVPAALSGVRQTLQRLDLGRNPGLQLAPHCFSGLSMLEELCLSNCGLTAVPAALAGVGHTLQQLQLSYNLGLQLAPRCFRSLRKLEELYLGRCGLTEVPAPAVLSGVGHTLRVLDLGWNPGLQLAPDCFSGLSMLEELNLAKCGLTAVPAALSGIGRTLRWLHLSDNYPRAAYQPGWLRHPAGAAGAAVSDPLD